MRLIALLAILASSCAVAQTDSPAVTTPGHDQPFAATLTLAERYQNIPQHYGAPKPGTDGLFATLPIVGSNHIFEPTIGIGVSYWPKSQKYFFAVGYGYAFSNRNQTATVAWGYRLGSFGKRR